MTISTYNKTPSAEYNTEKTIVAKTQEEFDQLVSTARQQLGSSGGEMTIVLDSTDDGKNVAEARADLSSYGLSIKNHPEAARLAGQHRVNLNTAVFNEEGAVENIDHQHDVYSKFKSSKVTLAQAQASGQVGENGRVTYSSAQHAPVQSLTAPQSQNTQVAANQEMGVNEIEAKLTQAYTDFSNLNGEGITEAMQVLTGGNAGPGLIQGDPIQKKHSVDLNGDGTSDLILSSTITPYEEHSSVEGEPIKQFISMEQVQQNNAGTMVGKQLFQVEDGKLKLISKEDPVPVTQQSQSAEANNENNVTPNDAAVTTNQVSDESEIEGKLNQAYTDFNKLNGDAIAEARQVFQPEYNGDRVKGEPIEKKHVVDLNGDGTPDLVLGSVTIPYEEKSTAEGEPAKQFIERQHVRQDASGTFIGRQIFQVENGELKLISQQEPVLVAQSSQEEVDRTEGNG